MCTEESDERSHNSVEETARRPKRRFALFFIQHRIRALRFLRKPGRDHYNGHTCAVDPVGQAPSRPSPAFVPVPPIAHSASPTTICENIIHPRRCPSRLNNGKSTRSIKGAHRNFSEYAMPTQERNPIAVREVCSSRSQ